MIGNLLSREIGPWELYVMFTAVEGVLAVFVGRLAWRNHQRQLAYALWAYAFWAALTGLATFNIQFPPLTVEGALKSIGLDMVFLVMGNIRATSLAEKHSRTWSWESLEATLGTLSEKWKTALEWADEGVLGKIGSWASQRMTRGG